MITVRMSITAPTEPLAARTDKPSLSRDQALRDALTTAVRSRKPVLLTCLDKTANARIEKVGVALAAGKATIATVSTGDADADACVKKRFGEVATWLAVNRAGLTIFAHASTGDDRQDHGHNVIWFGPSEPLDLRIFG